MKTHSILFISLFFILVLIVISLLMLNRDNIAAKYEETGIYLSGTLERYNGQTTLNWIDHSAVDANVFGTKKYIDNADVLFVGNSRTILSFDRDVYREFFAKKKLNYFNIGKDYGESMDFFIHLFEKLDIKNKTIIINIDSFFQKGLSVAGANAMKGDVFNFLFVNSSLYKELFTTNFFKTFHVREVLRYKRYINDGSAVAAEGYENVKVGDAALYVEEINAANLMQSVACAEKFMDFAKGRNIKVIFTIIPASFHFLGTNDLKYLAGKFYVDYFLVDSDNLSTYDGSHLNLASAKLYSERSIVELDKLLK